jgi:CTP-dependent riboflavin kinase
VLLAGKLEAMLAESEPGLSAATVSKRADASYRQVLVLLRELEQTGRVRRSGTSRTSLWRVVTDEERIAERAAELARQSAGARSGIA